MERYRLLGIEHDGREGVSARVVSREPNKWGVFPLHTFNSGDEVVLAADAQATIAALQARAEQAERLVASQAQEIIQRRQTLGDLAHLHQEQSKQLTQRTAELNEIEKIVDIDSGKTLIEKVRDLKHSFKQVYDSYQDAANEMFKAQDERTAELEAAKASQAIDLKNNNAYREQVATLQAELERVTGELVETSLYLQQERANRDSLAACVDRDVKTIKELRTLVLALPKVEGEIADETILDLWESDAITFDALRGLLLHRQGVG